MGFSDDGVTQAALDDYYAHSAKYADLSIYSVGSDALGLSAEAPWELERARNLVSFAEPFVSKSELVFDVGCSTGTALVILREAGYVRLGGMDPMEAAVSVARDARGLDVIRGGFGTPHPAGRPDVIIASHVLEHVLNLGEAVAELAASLAVGGRAVVEVPDAARFSEYVSAPYQDFNTEHINHFSLAHLDALMASVGFEALSLAQGLARSGPEHDYPVARGVWKYTGRQVDPRTIADASGAHHAALVAYAEESERIFVGIDERILAGLGDEEFVLWGAGQFAMKLMMRPTFPMAQCIGIVDSSPSRIGLELNGFRVSSPDGLVSGSPRVILPGSVFGAESIRQSAERLGLASRVVDLGT